MKININKICIIALCCNLFFVTTSCEDFLEEEVFTQFDPDTFLQDQNGIDALLTGAYSAFQVTGYRARDSYSILGEFPTDITWETGGGLNRLVVPIMQFTWDPSLTFFNSQYNKYYSAISRANNVLLVTSTLSDIDQETVNKINGEARFIRAASYYTLYNLFGTTPIVEIPEGASLDDITALGETPRATEEEYRNIVETDLLFAADNLDADGISSRANKGSAYAFLTKYFLNTKQWQKAADAANEVLGLNYTLYNDYTNLFSIEGENNNEFIFRFECLIGSGQTNVYMPHAFPPNYPILSNWNNFGAQFRTYTSFYETFENQDARRQLFVAEYTPNGSTDVVQLNRDLITNEALDNVRSFKFLPDPNGIGSNHGNDIPVIRLADIILARAEALNEISGPTQEAINLINQVRNRVSATAISLVDFSTKEELRDFILEERGREFYTEGFRREDLIRHNKFIQQAVDRGVSNAQPFHVLYPLPQSQIDNNPNLAQNPGYN